MNLNKVIPDRINIAGKEDSSLFVMFTSDSNQTPYIKPIGS